MDLCELEVGEVVFAECEDLSKGVLCAGEVSAREADGGALVQGGEIGGVSLEAVIVDLQGVARLALGEGVLREREERRERQVGGVVGQSGGARGERSGERVDHEGDRAHPSVQLSP